MKKIAIAGIAMISIYSYAQITLTKDLSFGNNGIVEIGNSNNFALIAPNHSTFQGNKIFISYTSEMPGNPAAVATRFVRLNPNGSMDVSFGTNGEFFIPDFEAYHFYANESVLYLNSGKKYFSNGQLDTAFGNNGTLTTGNWNYKFVLLDGKIVSRNDTEIRQFLSNGNPDPAYGNNGILNINPSIYNSSNNYGDLFYYKDNYMYENVTQTGEITKLRKINLSTGNLDLLYGQNGYGQIRSLNSLNFNYYNGSVLTNDNDNSFINSFDNFNNYCQLTRTNSSGNLDLSFGTNGTITINNTYTYNGEVYAGRERAPLLYGNNIILQADNYTASGVAKKGISCYSFAGNNMTINNEMFYPLPDVNITSTSYTFIKDNYLYVFFDNKIVRYIFSQSTLSASEDIKKENSVKFNNPFKDKLILNSQEGIKQVEVFDETGRLVLKSSAVKNIDTSDLQNGIYFIKITTENNQVISKKGIKN